WRNDLIWVVGLGRAQPQASEQATAPEPLADRVDHDRAEPRGKRLRVLQRAQSLEGCAEHVLHDVVDVSVSGEQAVREPEDEVCVPAEKGLEGPFVSAAGGYDQGCIRWPSAGDSRSHLLHPMDLASRPRVLAPGCEPSRASGFEGRASEDGAGHWSGTTKFGVSVSMYPAPAQLGHRALRILYQ